MGNLCSNKQNPSVDLEKQTGKGGAKTSRGTVVSSVPKIDYTKGTELLPESDLKAYQHLVEDTIPKAAIAKDYHFDSPQAEKTLKN